MKIHSFKSQKTGQELSVSYEENTPSWFSYLFGQIARAYHDTANRVDYVVISKYNTDILDLVRNYFNDIDHNFRILQDKNEADLSQQKFPDEIVLDDGKAAIMFTSGKDSLHLTLRLIETGRFSNKDIVWVYVKNLNRSETHYEQISAKKLAEKLSIKLHIVDLKNSVKINRTGHNIGLREQLVLTLALPYIVKFKAKNVFFGLHASFVDVHKYLYSSHKSAFDLLSKAYKKCGILLDISNHIDYPEVTELGIARYLVENHRDLLDLTSSCYSQINWREQNHDREQAKTPDIKIYNGCGHCLKCLRINSAIWLWDENAKKAPLSQRSYLKKHIIQKHSEKGATDDTLAEAINLMLRYDGTGNIHNE